MKIVMLGHTGVGKTTYMASLYGVMQQSVEGFRLKAVNSKEHSHWLELAEAIRVGKYPLSTDQRNEYEFHLRYQGKNVLNFSWADYRGGALRESQDSEQAKLLLQDLRTADGIMLFCDCNALDRDDTRSNQIGRMAALVSHALQELDHPVSLGIILTKIDIVSNFTEKLLNPFSGLISAINASELVLGAFIPIACGIQLCNVPMPLLFVLQAAVSLQAASSYKLFQQHTSEAASLKKISEGFIGKIDWVVSKTFSWPTNKEKISIEMKKAVEKLREFESIKEPAECLSHYVQKLPLVQPDMSLSQYAEDLSQIKRGITTHSIDNSNPFSVFN